MPLRGRIAHNAVDDTEEISNPRRRFDLLLTDFHGDRHLRALLLIPARKSLHFL
ncbi:MAG: hypothetical protein WCC41_01010 [Rhodomicrobium sp.]